MSQISADSTVSLHVTGKTANGDVFTSTENQDPLKMTLGQGQFLPAIEEALVGLGAGDKKNITLEPDEGFGPRQEELVFQVPRDQFPEDLELEAGLHLQMQQPDGQTALVLVVAIEEESVTLDANNPLAGQTVSFDLEVVEIH